MENGVNAAGLSQIGSRYLTRTTIHSAATAGLQKVLSADARRFSLRFMPAGIAASVPIVVPGPPPAALAQGAITTISHDWYYAQWPGAVGGEFYANMAMGTAVTIVEQLYLE